MLNGSVLFVIFQNQAKAKILLWISKNILKAYPSIWYNKNVVMHLGGAH